MKIQKTVCDNCGGDVAPMDSELLFDKKTNTRLVTRTTGIGKHGLLRFGDLCAKCAIETIRNLHEQLAEVFGGEE